jgi:hypothetical protein
MFCSIDISVNISILLCTLNHIDDNPVVRHCYNRLWFVVPRRPSCWRHLPGFRVAFKDTLSRSTMPFASVFFNRHSFSLLFTACFVVVQLIAPVTHFETYQLTAEPLSVAHSRTASKHTVFYNIFVSPSDQSLGAQGIRIVHEQLRQLAKSYAARQWNDQNEAEHPLDVLYITIGAANISETVVQPDCKALKLHCVHLGHFDAAHEEQALGALHRFCKSKKQVEHIVIYIHTKGSFNWRNGSQEELRRASTAAVTSEFCLRSLEEHENKSFPSTSSRQCNACGLLFQPLPGLHFPGNFFSAKCSYISQLLSPRKFNGRADYLKRGDLVLRASGTKQGNFYGWSPGSVGFARYAYERKYPRGQSPKWTQEEYPYRLQGFVYEYRRNFPHILLHSFIPFLR